MKRSSWIVLLICVILAGGLLVAFLVTQNAHERLTQEEAMAMTRQMETALEHKNANTILGYIAPSSDTRIANINQDQLRLLLIRYFRSSDHLSAKMTNYAFAGGEGDATLQFDLVVNNDGPDSRKEDYVGHITLHLHRVDVSHLFGLYQTKEWRISSAESTGPDLSTFGD